MNTLVIYDETGFILMTMIGTDVRKPVGVPYLIVEIPQGKILKGIDVTVTPNVAILEDVPPTEVAILKQQVDDLNIAVASMMGV